MSCPSTKVVKAETSTTWEHGRLKLTLTRQPMVDPQGRTTSKAKVSIAYKDDYAFLWLGTLEDFRSLSGSIAAVYSKVDEEVFGATSDDGFSVGAGPEER